MDYGCFCKRKRWGRNYSRTGGIAYCTILKRTRFIENADQNGGTDCDLKLSVSIEYFSHTVYVCLSVGNEGVGSGVVWKSCRG